MRAPDGARTARTRWSGRWRTCCWGRKGGRQSEDYRAEALRDQKDEQHGNDGRMERHPTPIGPRLNSPVVGHRRHLNRARDEHLEELPAEQAEEDDWQGIP